jgi:hypothetical protein
MNAFDLLRDLESRGVVLTPDGGKLVVDAPAGALNAADRDWLVKLKPDLLVILTRRQGGPSCPTCKRSLDDKGRCWQCCDRQCEGGCGRWTGSAFLAYCLQCEGLTEDKAETFMERLAIATVDGHLPEEGALRLAWDQHRQGPPARAGTTDAPSTMLDKLSSSRIESSA